MLNHANNAIHSPETSVFWCQKSRRHSKGSSPMVAPKTGGVSSNDNFRPISRYISEMVQVRDIVTGNANRNLYVLYWLVLFRVTLTDTNYPKPPHLWYILSPFISSYWVEFETYNLVGRLTVASACPRTANHPWKGRIQVAWAIYILVSTNYISGTADRLRRCQLSSLVSVINFWWSSDNCWSHSPSKSVFSS